MNEKLNFNTEKKEVPEFIPIEGFEYGVPKIMSHQIPGVGDFYQGLIVGPKDAGKFITIYHARTDAPDGHLPAFEGECLVPSEDKDLFFIVNEIEPKSIEIPKVETPTVFSVHDFVPEWKDISAHNWEHGIQALAGDNKETKEEYEKLYKLRPNLSK